MDTPVRHYIQEQYSVCYRQNRFAKNPFHFHDELEIFMVIDGADFCLIDDELIRVEPYDILIFHPNQVHRLVDKNTDSYERYVITVKMEYLFHNQVDHEITNAFFIAKMMNKHLIKPTPEQINILTGRMQACIALEQTTGQTKQTALKLKFLEIMTYISELIYADNGIIVNAGNDRMDQILAYINAHFQEADFSLERIACACNISRNYLCSIFRKYTSLTVTEYVTSKRIIASKKLLLDGCNVTEAAQKAGFSDLSNFIRVFKQQVGATPKQYQLRNTGSRNYLAF